MLTLLRAVVVAATLLWAGGGVAAADPASLDDVAQSAATVDGWQVSAALTRMTINAVPNMAETAFSREGFITATATATLQGAGSKPVNSGVLRLSVQLGCQTDVRAGMSLSVSVVPAVSVALQPGAIYGEELDAQAIKGPVTTISVHDAHVKVDGCGGPVSVRLIATAHISTDTSGDTVNAYGDILHL